MITIEALANPSAALIYNGDMNTKARGILNTFGKRVRVLREGMGLNQEDLCDQVRTRTGVTLSRPHLSNLERGDKMPALETAVALAQVLDTSIDYLAMLTDNPAPTGNEEPQPEYYSAEADETARLVDDLPPLLRAAVIVNARAISDAERDRRARNVAYYPTSVISFPTRHQDKLAFAPRRRFNAPRNV